MQCVISETNTTVQIRLVIVVIVIAAALVMTGTAPITAVMLVAATGTVGADLTARLARTVGSRLE
jgi:hypothetical protein